MLWNGTAFNFETVMDVRLVYMASSCPVADFTSRHITTSFKQVLPRQHGHIAMTG